LKHAQVQDQPLAIRLDTTTTSGSVSPAPGAATGTGSTTTTSNTGTADNASGSTGSTSTTSSGTSGTGNSGTGNSAAGGTTSDEATQFIQQAAVSGMSEVMLSQLALKNAQSSEVKQYAAMMVKDHGNANAELKALAGAKNITLPDSSSLSDPTSTVNTAGGTGSGSTTDSGTSGGTTGSATSGTTGTADASQGGRNMNPAEKMDALRTSSTKEFDQNYVQLMIRDHVKAVSLFESGSRSADPQVKAYATKHLPTLRMHLEHATALGKKTMSKTGGQ
jgi:putative membrane protein